MRLWNEIPRRIRDLPKKEFKGEIRRLLLNILENENDYIETPIIVQKIGFAKDEMTNKGSLCFVD